MVSTQISLAALSDYVKGLIMLEYAIFIILALMFGPFCIAMAAGNPNITKFNILLYWLGLGLIIVLPGFFISKIDK
jgi:hypothetical protein